MSNKRAVLELTVGGLMLSLSALAVAFAHIGAGGAGFYRMLFASVLFYLFLKVRKVPVWLKDPKARRYTAWAGVFLAIDLILWHQSIYIVGPGIGSILTNCQVFFMTLLGLYLLKERPSVYFVVSISLAFLGLYLLLLPEMATTVGIKGVVYGVLSGLAYAVCVYFLKVNTTLPEQGGDKIAQMLNLSLWAALVLLAYALVNGESLAIVDGQTLVMLIVYGVLVQFVGWLMVNRSIGAISLGLAGLILLLEPVITYFIDVVFLHKATSLMQMTGAAVTVVAVYIGSIRPPEKAPVLN
ncbi:DMT family transporter [Pseudomonas gingeri]|uniref:DMT family transporter n=1 Tax=Pseudomonas gingeri TaxID=117681 RepID=UPI0015A1038A|nr:DMT family transporter [Pseudomonas gingeri]NWA01392.1 DMT family transporter [Pseudomonas gingeri]NWA13805.1 DMT family transporter [Pseudomonas gingeri]NWA52835.1 DMT family transporter [Pseudomonas gingeri]NWA96332.1 DMT family transporter [Pseudomonas gingeri]NWB00032.1 DMT family transporter [Pseudomonas gingeri]